MGDWWIDETPPQDPEEHWVTLDLSNVKTDKVIAPYPGRFDRLPQPGEIYKDGFGQPLGVVLEVEVIKEMNPGFSPETRSRTEITLITQQLNQDIAVPLVTNQRDPELEAFIKGIMFK